MTAITSAVRVAQVVNKHTAHTIVEYAVIVTSHCVVLGSEYMQRFRSLPNQGSRNATQLIRQPAQSGLGGLRSPSLLRKRRADWALAYGTDRCRTASRNALKLVLTFANYYCSAMHTCCRRRIKTVGYNPRIYALSQPTKPTIVREAMLGCTFADQSSEGPHTLLLHDITYAVGN